MMRDGGGERELVVKRLANEVALQLSLQTVTERLDRKRQKKLYST